LKLELQDIDKEIKNTGGQIDSLRDKITQEEKQLEQLTQASDAAKVTTVSTVYVQCTCSRIFSLVVLIEKHS